MLNHFGSAKSVEAASFEDLKSVEGIEEKVAKKIHDFFHEGLIMKIKIPNILTIGRIIIVPIFVISFYIPGIVGDLVPFFFLFSKFYRFFRWIIS